jgi:mycothiol synthase
VVEIRVAAGDDDLEAMAAVRALIVPDLGASPDELRHMQHLLERSLLLVAGNVGYALAGLWAGDEPAFADLGVAPAARGRGVGTALLARVSEYARSFGGTELQGEVREGDEDSLAWVGRRGFIEVERQKGVALDLSGAPGEAPEPPAGIRVLSWAEAGLDDALLRRMHAVGREANADIPGLDSLAHPTLEQWLRFEVERPFRRSDLCFVAFVGDEVAGYCTMDVFGTSGHHGLTGVARAFRRRGVARALKQTQIAAAKAAGLERLLTESEETNAPMRALNDSLGYREIPGSVVVRGPAAP